MECNNIELITCESGDWEALKVNGNLLCENHSISSMDWVNILSKMNGFTCSIKEISDEDMENGKY